MYLNKNGLDYQYSDIKEIAKLQLEKEALLGRPLIVDNDLINLYIWSIEKFGKVDPLISNELELYREKRTYFLCSPDIPWEPDPQRENPHDRNRLFEIYLSIFKQYELPYQIISGNHEFRLESVLKHLGIEY